MAEDTAQILVLYYSRHGSVRALARLVARGVEAVSNAEAVLRTVPPVSADHESSGAAVPDAGDPYVTLDDLARCDGLALGSAMYFGNMASPMKYFWDTTTSVWANGGLVGKPAGVFGATSSMHGGQESGLLSMMIPLLHHGMIISGLPFTEKALNRTTTGGTPYGASHVAGPNNDAPVSEHEKELCQALGGRIARLALKLK